jgi:hypothetical protein
MLCMRGQSQQTTIDALFASLCDTGLPHRGISDPAFAKAEHRSFTRPRQRPGEP